MARLMILVERPRQSRGDEAEAWLQGEIRAFGGEGVERVQLMRLAGASPPSSETWSWMVQIDCEDLDAAREVLANGPAMTFLGDLRLLGMRPSVALIEKEI